MASRPATKVSRPVSIDATDGLAALLNVGAVLVAGVVYFLPIIIAVVRRHPKLGLIFVMNWLLGLTVIFWIYALVWAIRPFEKPKKVRVIILH